MAAGQQYKAVFDFTSTGEGILSFKVGEQFTLVSKTNENWWLVRSPSGEKGLAPISYLEACPMRNGGPMKSAAYTAVYDYTAQTDSQMSFTKGQTLFLIDKTDVSWWTMQTLAGKQGLVPVNYIDKLDLPEGGQGDTPSSDGTRTSARISPNASSNSVTGTTQHTSNHDDSSAASSPPDSASLPDESFQQVLASIDSNITRIHADATKQGGLYSAKQKETLNKLILHRQSFISSNKPPPTQSPNHTPISRPLQSPPKSSSLSPKKTLTPHHSPIPKRHAPPPPASSAKTNGSPSKGSPTSKRRQTMDDASKKNHSKNKDNRYSLHLSVYTNDTGNQPNFSSLPRKSAPRPPVQQIEDRRYSEQTPKLQEQQFQSLHRPQSYSGQINSIPSSKPPPSSSSPSYSPARRMSESGAPKHAHSLSSPDKSPRRLNKSSSDLAPRQRTSSAGNMSSSRSSLGQNNSASPSPRSSRGSSKEGDSLTLPPTATTFVVAPPIPTLAPPPVSKPGTTLGTASVTTPPVVVSTPTTPKLTLPTSFSSSVGTELVETVRKAASITHRKAQLAVGSVLQCLKKEVPQCEGMVEGLFAALEKAMQENTASVSERHSDLERLKEILFEITECKDDSQQRGWAVHDDEKAISDLLEELLQILCDANPEVSKVAVMEDKYENVLTLITYYQMEPRVPIRLLLLKVFGVLCGLDRTVIGILLASVLPNELGRDIQQDMGELQKALYSSTVCTMIFSTAEAVPLSVYDQWDVDYIKFLLDTIEAPPPDDVEEQLPDAFLNMVLGFNQHFPDPAFNLVMKALKQRPNPRNFSEKLMFVINRGEDPVAITKPCCPDSFTKLLLDVFSDNSTAGMFYTTDMMVLIDIVTRQLTDLCPGMETRTHYLELLYRMVGSTDYRDHLHRQRDLAVCLNRIANEEEVEGGQPDRELVKKIWMTYPQVFEEITDL